MTITMMDYATAKAATDRKLARGIDGWRAATKINQTALALLGFAFIGYTIARMIAA